MSNFDYRDLMSSATLSAIRPVVSGNKAEWMHERVVRSIARFENDLDREHEVGARLVSFGEVLTFHIEDVGFWGPDMIVFRGFDQNNKKVELLQHISQLNVLLVAVAKTQENPRRIGFRLTEGMKKDDGRD